MRGRNAVVAAVALAAALAGCGESCPTEAAYAESGQDMGDACSARAPQQVAIDVRLCEACSHTAPTCEADLVAASDGLIYLDMRWDICPDDSSCSAAGCEDVTCVFTVPDGPYRVEAAVPSGSVTFDLVVSGSSASCSGTL